MLSHAILKLVLKFRCRCFMFDSKLNELVYWHNHIRTNSLLINTYHMDQSIWMMHKSNTHAHVMMKKPVCIITLTYRSYSSLHTSLTSLVRLCLCWRSLTGECWKSFSSDVPDTSSLSPSEPILVFSCTTPSETDKAIINGKPLWQAALWT